MPPINYGIKESAGELRELIRASSSAEELKMLFPLYWLKSNPGMNPESICQSLCISISDLNSILSSYRENGIIPILNKGKASNSIKSRKRQLAEYRSELNPSFGSLKTLAQLKPFFKSDSTYLRYNEIHELFFECFGIPFHRAVARLSVAEQGIGQ